MKRNNKKGFTIVELVIVIAVIAILSAVLIPTFGGITEKAQASAAQQEVKNIHTLYLANIDYANGETAELIYVEHDDKYYSVGTDGKITPVDEVPAGYVTKTVNDVPAEDTVYILHATHTYDQEGDKCVCGAEKPVVTP